MARLLLIYLDPSEHLEIARVKIRPGLLQIRAGDLFFSSLLPFTPSYIVQLLRLYSFFTFGCCWLCRLHSKIFQCRSTASNFSQPCVILRWPPSREGLTVLLKIWAEGTTVYGERTTRLRYYVMRQQSFLYFTGKFRGVQLPC